MCLANTLYSLPLCSRAAVPQQLKSSAQSAKAGVQVCFLLKMVPKVTQSDRHNHLSTERSADVIRHLPDRLVEGYQRRTQGVTSVCISTRNLWESKEDFYRNLCL